MAATAGCDRLDVGFGVALDVAFASTVTDAEVATVTRLRFIGQGDEATDIALDLGRTMSREERLVYRPDLFTRRLEIAVLAETAQQGLVAVGSTGPLTLRAGETSRAEVILRHDSEFDGGVGDLTFTGDLSGQDLTGADLAGTASTIVFDCPSTRLTSATANRLLAADLNGDGRDDLIAAYDTSGQLEIYLGSSGGELPAPLTLGLGASLIGLAIGDVDADGLADLVTTTTSSTGQWAVRVHAGKGDGTFTTRPPLYAGTTALGAIAIDQLDTTGGRDIAVVASNNKILVLYDVNPAGTSVAATREIDVASVPAQLAIGRLNGDALPDIIGLEPSTATLTTVLNTHNTSARTFGTAGSSSGVGSLTSAGAMVFTQLDGMPGDDVAISSGSGDNVTYLLNGGTGVLTASSARYTPSQVIRGFAVRDLDTDGKIDLLALHTGDATPVSLTVVHGALDSVSVPQTIAYAVGAAPARVVAGDFNGDGMSDVAVASGNLPTIAIALGRGGGRLGAGEIFTPPGRTNGLAGVAIGSPNGNAGASLFAAEGGANRLARYGPGGTRGQYLLDRDFVDLPAVRAVVVGDANGNGTEDLIVSYMGNLGFADAHPSAMTLMSTPVGGSNKDVLLADLFGNGPLAVVVESRLAGGRVHLVQLGAAGIPLTIDVPGTTDLRTALAGDWNGDGLVDLAVIDGSPNASKLVVLAQGPVKVFTAQPAIMLSLAEAKGLARLRLDADQYDDLAVGGLGGLYLYRGGATGLVNLPVTPGSSLEGIASADLDGDGRLDLISAVSTHFLVISSGATFQPSAICLNGSSNGRLAIGDVDGDKRLDIVSSGPGGGAVLLRNRSP
jgi:adhesin/invasin